MKHITKDQLDYALNIKDLSEQEGHAFNQLVSLIKKALHEKYGIEPKIEKGQKIVSMENNFYKLGYATNEVSMGSRYTRYVTDVEILRTQMTSTVPPLLEQFAKKPENLKVWMCPGLVFRRDVIDKTHVGEPHQMDIWLLKKGQTERKDLLELIELVVGCVGKVLGKDLKYRCNETTHNYTEGGLEVEVFYNGKWLEVLECGLAGKKLLETCGVDSSQYAGLALGMGLDRLVMLAKKITDIRVFRDSDPRVQAQMNDLKTYKEVSKLPSIKRDFSIAVSKDFVIEELCEKIQKELGSKFDMVEEVSLKAQTPYEKLPQVAVEKLGMNPDQENWLLTITLRHPSRSIESKEANELYETLYTKIHEGSTGYFKLN